MYGQQQGQNQAQIPFSKKKELEAMVAQGKIDMAAGKITDWELAKKLQEAAMGVESSQPMEALKDIRYGQPGQEGDDGMSFVGGRRAKGQPPGPVQFQQAGTPATGLSREQILAQDAGVMSAGPTEPIQMRGSTEMGRTPPGIIGANVGPGPSTMPQESLPTLMNESGMSRQMVGVQPRTVDPHLRNEGILTREMANRPKAGPNDNPIIGGLRSAGKAAGGYMKSLFNDPQRMAMLQGGLSMMDPNSYYDKQGFGSVFTGLNKGLGAAQQGHKGVLDRRALVQKTATDKAAAARAMRGGAYSTVQVGPNKMQQQKDGVLIGEPFDKTPGKDTYKTITENTENGGTRKVNYRIDAITGNKTQESVSDVTKIVAGVNKEGKLTVQQWNNTTQTAKDLVVKETDFTPAEVMGAVNILNDLDKWGEILDANPMAAGELVGKAFSAANWLSESFNQGTPFEGRAEIETMIKQLKPMLTPEILKDSRISEAEWMIAKAALGMGEWSTGMDKKRAIPALKKIIRIRSGLPLEGGLDLKGGTKTATGYTPGSQAKHF